MRLHITNLVTAFVCLILVTFFSHFVWAQDVAVIEDGDVAGLIQALENANANPGTDSIVLAENGTYVLEARHSCVTNGFFDYRENPVLPCEQAGAGPVGLPQVLRADWGGKLIVNGRGSVIRRSTSAAPFRIWYVWIDAVVDFYNLTFENGFAFESLRPQRDIVSGGAIFIAQDSQVRVENCNFRNNRSQNEGGAISVSARSHARVINCEFRNNEAVVQGGGIHNVVAPITVINSNFFDNRCGVRGGGIYVDGNDWTVDGSQTIIKDCIFENNLAAAQDDRAKTGGGLYVFLYKDHEAIIDGCTFRNNLATGPRGQGGGLWLGSGALIIDGDQTFNVGNVSEFKVSNSLVVDNRSTFLGGGIIMADGDFGFVNTTIVQNRVENNRGTDALGGGLLYNNSDIILINCTVSENFAGNRGGGVFFNEPNGGNASRSEFYNCLLVDNTAFNRGDGAPTIQNNCTPAVNRRSFGNNNIEFPDLSGKNADDFCLDNVQLIEPNLGILQDNGGAVLTMLPNEGSPAIGTGDINFLPEIFRPESGVVNIGAFPLAFNTVPNYRLRPERIPGEGDGFVGNVFPNPLGDDLLSIEINPTVEIANEVTVTIADRNGKVFYKQSGNIDGGSNVINIPLAGLGLQPGLYLVSIRSGGLADTKRLVIVGK